MADPGRRERRRKVAIDQVPQPDQDARGQPGLGFRQDLRERFCCATAELLQTTTRIVGRGQDLERPRGQRPGCPDPEQVRAVRRIGPWPDRARDGDPVARDDDRVAGQGSGDTERAFGTGRGRQGRRLRPVARRPGGLDDEGPRTVAVGWGVEGRRPGRDDRQPDGDETGPDRDRQQGPDIRLRPRLADEQDGRQGKRDRRSEMARRDLSGGDGRDDGTQREPAAPTHLNEPSRDP